MGTEFARRVSAGGLAAVVAGAAVFVSSPPPSVVAFFGVLSVGVGFGALTAALYAYLGAKMDTARSAPEEKVHDDPVSEASGAGTGGNTSDETRPMSADGTGEGGFLYAAERAVSRGEESAAVAAEVNTVEPEPGVVEAEDAEPAIAEAEDAGSGSVEAEDAEPAVDENEPVEDQQPASYPSDDLSGSDVGQFTFFSATGSATSVEEPPDVETTDDRTAGDADRSADADDGQAEQTPRDDVDPDGGDTFVLGGDEFVVGASPER